ncbi:hypothetical protein HF1_08580 [Mycoplasma haemofelis str. Langford 1]|uniref:Uncharacterized protein n=1 Tax=Mycoplasma haemofelis (strain Langford 1) TaxID=941640 RepID=E8ZI95_MYCHL|nr:hypothetical protein [Mycoplasma haemofelis]CBY92866.1 hypothetical protein HF1_08580 [Mycoplasma haemofelis str. Langford 1]
MNKRVLTGVGAGMTATVAGVGGLYMYQSEGDSHEEPKTLTTSISQLFQQSKNKVLLTKSSTGEEWNRAWGRYKLSHQDKTSDEWGIPDFSKNQGSYDALPEFQDACTSRHSLEIESTEDINYKRVEDWCTRPKKIAELLGDEEGIELIPETGADSDWTSSWGKYRESQKASNGSSYKETDDWGISSWKEDKDKETLSNGFKSKCLDNSKQDIDKGSEDKLYQQVKSWCTRIKV